VRGWYAVTDAVHDAGGYLRRSGGHTGSTSHPDSSPARTVAPSAVDPDELTAVGGKSRQCAGAMPQDDIRTTISDLATGAGNAMRAGFDGVQLQAGLSSGSASSSSADHDAPTPTVART